MKKYIIVALLVAGLLAAPAMAQTVDNTVIIQQLIRQLIALQQQLIALLNQQGGNTGVAPMPIYPPDDDASNFQVIAPDNNDLRQLGETVSFEWLPRNAGVKEIKLIPNFNSEPFIIFAKKVLDNDPVYGGSVRVALPTAIGGLGYGETQSFYVQLTTVDGRTDRSDTPFRIMNPGPTTGTPYITVLSPNGGEDYRIGDRVAIKWEASGLANIPSAATKWLSLYLVNAITGARYAAITCVYSGGVYNPNCPVYSLNTDGGAIYHWTIPTSIPVGKYKIGAAIFRGDANVAVATDLSDQFFTITSTISSGQPYITSVAGKAAGNNEIDAGGMVAIQGTNFASYTKGGTRVYIGGLECPWTQLGDTLIYCTAPSSLQVGQTYDLYINTTLAGGDKGSSNIVRVKVLSNLSGTPSITVLSPNGGESYVAGRGNLEIKYASRGLEGRPLTAYLWSPTYGNVRSMTNLTAQNSGTVSLTLEKGGADLPGQYKINLCSPDAKAGVCDYSDNYFTLIESLVATCPAPYHVTAADGRCVWSCGVGTTPDNASNECVCQSGLAQTGTDSFGRRVCAAPATSQASLYQMAGALESMRTMLNQMRSR